MHFDYPYNESVSYITDHVYAECYLPEGRFLVDPMKGLIIKIFSEKNKLTMYRIKDYQYIIEVF